MAWSAVASAVTTIGKLVAGEGSYLWGVEEQVDRLLTDLKWMKNFLASEAGDGASHLQAAYITDLAYDAEDVVETFDLKIVSKRKPGFTNCIKRYGCILHELWMLHQTRSDIDKIITKSNDLVRLLQAYEPNTSRGGGASSSLTDMKEKRRPFPHIIDKNTVGLDDDIEKLVALLENERSEYRVVSICGTGGLGKTTLAKKIYHHRRVTTHFKHVAFVYVSRPYERRNVWEDILSNFTSIQEGDSKLSVEQFAEKLFKFLEENKCLVILDDIWDVKAWNDLKPAFSLQGNSKSKILLTTRHTNTVSDADGRGHAYELPRLTDQESWELFEKITSPPTDTGPEYEELGMKMVQRCPRLPLAIVALGGILAKENSVIGWRKVSENVEFYLRDEKVKELTLEQVLALSYDYLPHHLRSCFLYLSHFPEDYEIETQRLIELLVAEGIAPPEKQGEIAEDVAEGYLMELAERFMIQPREIDLATSKITSFQLHDEMRLLCLSKAKEDNFVFIVDESNASSLPTIRKVRRISAHKFIETQRIQCPNLRSLSFFNKQYLEDSIKRGTASTGVACVGDILDAYILFLKARGFWVHISTNLKLLRVLNCEGLCSYAGCKLIGDIENLIHLRFLRLGNLVFKELKLPSSLGNLICLQTLDLRLNCMHIPDVIWRMKQLRHLYLPYPCEYKTKLQLHTLKNLLTLVNFNTKSCYLKDLIHMTNLRELEIRGNFEIEDFNAENLGNNPPIIEGKHLRSLSIISEERMNPEHLNHLLSCCASIHKLSLYVKISKLPELRYLSLNLAYIHFENYFLEEDPMPTLEKLPNLRILELSTLTLTGREMTCSAQGFPKLESLSLTHFHQLEQWNVNEGAMPCLQRLEIRGCSDLDMGPIRQRFNTILTHII